MSLHLAIPVFSERLHDEGRGKTYRVCPAFPSMPHGQADDFSVFHPREDRGIEELTRMLRKEFNALAKEMRHDALLRWSFNPDAVGKKIQVDIYLRKQSVTGELFVIVYRAFDRRIVCIPKLPGVTFDLERGQRIEDRANETLTRFFRIKEKQSEGRLDLEQYLSPGQARLTSIELTIRTRQEYKDPAPPEFAMLGGGEKMSGAQELEKVGRCLNRLYPHRLSRAILREGEVGMTSDHFSPSVDRPQPLALVGPNQVGKSAIVEEFLYRMISDQDRPSRELWLISPQRMISGMSFVGQWEERAHAIFQEAVRRKHYLYFEDLPGLFQAGKTRDSDLTVGHILKAYFEDGGLHVIAEATLESWRKLREIDRGFADFFRTLPVEETSEKDTIRILIRTIQELEIKEDKTSFLPDLIPTVYELQKRFARTRAFPGKAVEIIQQLAQKYPGRELDREDVFHYFQVKTGIQRQFLLQQQGLNREDIAVFFNERIKGQPEAVAAMTDLVVNCLSQLNEPGRPLGSLLFLGPTGVGKTESAKALSQYFFGTDERLIRFDLNEFVGPDAVERLIGSPFRPRGLLTAAVRRQPYSVILLDEIEKAHPRVFDLLLQLLSDGRLTDATGETADFCNCIVVMTSNLGARNARHQLGFGNRGKDNAHVYREAAEKFFRPELFNRLDHIVPFNELSREDIESLVALMSEKALSRIGLSETHLSLNMHSDIYSRLADMGFKPEYGARALRRSVESYLIEPIALRLSELPRNQPAIVNCGCDDGNGLKFETSRLETSPPSGFFIDHFPLGDGESFVDALNDYLERIEDDLESWRDESDGVIDPVDPVQMRYFSLREDIVGLRKMRDFFHQSVENERKHRREHPNKPSPLSSAENFRFLADHDPELFLLEMYQTADAARFLKRSIQGIEPIDPISQVATDLVARASSLALMAACKPGEEDRCLIDIQGPDRNEIFRHWQYPLKRWAEISDVISVEEYYINSEDRLVDYDAESGGGFVWEEYWRTAFLVMEGPALLELLFPLMGTHLLITSSGRTAFADVRITSIPHDMEPSGFRSCIGEIPDPSRFEVRTIQSEAGSGLIDIGSGFATFNTSHKVWNLINPHLPVVRELKEFVNMRSNQNRP